MARTSPCLLHGHKGLEGISLLLHKVKNSTPSSSSSGKNLMSWKPRNHPKTDSLRQTSMFSARNFKSGGGLLSVLAYVFFRDDVFVFGLQ